VRGRVASVIVAVMAVATACASSHHAPTSGGTTTFRPHKPRLILSAHRGRPGAVIQVEGVNCPPLEGQRDELSWINSRANQALGQHLRVEPLHRTGDSLRATFKIPPRTPPGRGLLVLLCGGANGGNGNALGYVTVER
jgi:hypothetical protein